MAWCVLVALQLARKDRLISLESQENLFIMRWSALAKKQRCFSRDLTTDIGWMQNQGRGGCQISDTISFRIIENEPC